MDYDGAFYSYDQMRVFAEIGIALAEAQMAERPEAPPGFEGRDLSVPHREALARAEDALSVLRREGTPPGDLEAVTTERVAAVRQSYAAAVALADEKLALPEELWPVLGVDPVRENAMKATAEAWVAAIDATTQEV